MKDYGSRDIQIQARIKAIAKDIAAGTTIGLVPKYMALFNLKATQINHYVKQAKPLALKIQQQTLAKEQQAMEDTRIIELKSQVITKLERMKILNDIATGTTQITLRRPVWNAEDRKMQMVAVTNPPNERDRMKAIEILNAMDGSNAPIKTDNRHQVIAHSHHVIFEDYSQPKEING